MIQIKFLQKNFWCVVQNSQINYLWLRVNYISAHVYRHSQISNDYQGHHEVTAVTWKVGYQYNML